jgi:hypothetical protein
MFSYWPTNMDGQIIDRINEKVKSLWRILSTLFYYIYLIDDLSYLLYDIYWNEIAISMYFISYTITTIFEGFI